MVDPVLEIESATWDSSRAKGYIRRWLRALRQLPLLVANEGAASTATREAFVQFCESVGFDGAEVGDLALDAQEPCCRSCGCTEADCSMCVERTGEPCTWVEPDLCSACYLPTLDGSAKESCEVCLFCWPLGGDSNHDCVSVLLGRLDGLAPDWRLR